MKSFGFGLLPLCTLALGLSLGPVAASAQTGDAGRGSDLAQAWCAQCHIVDARGRGRTADMAPAFPVVAADPAKTPEYLAAWLSSEHARMPNFSLDRRDIADLVAYIRTLRRTPAQPPRP